MMQVSAAASFASCSPAMRLMHDASVCCCIMQHKCNTSATQVHDASVCCCIIFRTRTEGAWQGSRRHAPEWGSVQLPRQAKAGGTSHRHLVRCPRGCRALPPHFPRERTISVCIHLSVCILHLYYVFARPPTLFFSYFIFAYSFRLSVCLHPYVCQCARNICVSMC